MPLDLVTGPANAEKAGHVLAGVRAAAAAGDEPLLVVPNLQDVDAFRRELAGDGVALGITIERFGGLLGEIARRTGTGARTLSSPAVERAAGAVTRERLEAGALSALAASARTRGFPPALAALHDELTQARVAPQDAARALARWGRLTARRAYAEELGALLVALGARLEALGRPTAAAHAWAVLDALRLAPASWGATPVFLYGFDDLTAVQLDAVRTLALHAGARVTVSLPFEPRAAFAGRQRAYAELSAIAADGGRHEHLEASARHYEAQAAPVLHALERGLFEPAAAATAPGDAVEVLTGGGPRAELELVAERIARLHADGWALEDVAVAVRDLDAAAPLVRSVFAEAGIPVAVARWTRAADTALGRGLLALLRCALLDGGPEDLLIYLRTPGVVRREALVEGFEARLRREGTTTLEGALAAWEASAPFPLEGIARLRAAHEAGPVRLCERLSREARLLLAAPSRHEGAGDAPILGPARAADARAAARLIRLLADLRELASADRALAADPAALHEHLGAVEAPPADAPGPGLVTVADPLALRARRVRALFLCRLTEGAFPRPGRPEPFLGDAERREIEGVLADAGQPPLGLAPREDRLDGERYLLYSAISRPTRLLVLSWHRADEDGEALVRSPFAEDVLDLLDPAPVARDRRLGAVRWAPGAALGEHQRELDAAAAQGEAAARTGAAATGRAITHAAVLDELAARGAWSATELETYARCPVRWFVERLLRPGNIEPDAEPLGRGLVAHAVLERTLRDLAEAGGRLEEASLPRALALMRRHLPEVEAESPISPDPHRRSAERARVEADLARYLTDAARAGSRFAPAAFEVRFGFDDQEPVDIGGLSVRGKIDRVDRDAQGRAIIVDYKGRGKQHPWEKWLDEGLLQAALYARAYEALEDTEVVGALYQPLGAAPEASAPRGFLLEGADAERTDVKDASRIADEERDALLDAITARAIEVVDGIRAGRLEPRPERCAWDDSGCAHPSICRCAS